MDGPNREDLLGLRVHKEVEGSISRLHVQKRGKNMVVYGRVGGIQEGLP